MRVLPLDDDDGDAASSCTYTADETQPRTRAYKLPTKTDAGQTQPSNDTPEQQRTPPSMRIDT